MLKIDYPKSFDRNEYYKKISKKKFYIDKHDALKDIFIEHPKSQVTIEEIFNRFKELKKDNFDTFFKNISFKYLLIGNFRTLQKIKERLGTSEEIKKNKSISFLFNYTELRETYISRFFEDNLNIFTCYYCNIDYVNSYNVDKKKKNKFTLDHYYDKATYPYLALSLYNFVPSCYACNSKLKGTKEFSNLSPSATKFDFNEKVKFKLYLTDSCKDLNIKEKDNIDIQLKERYSHEYKNYIKDFKLNERYQAHKDIVFEMIQNAELYPESRLKELQDLTGIPYQEIKKDIFNLINDDANLSKKPFSKLIKDISQELGLMP